MGLTLEALPLTPEQRDVLQDGMALSGSADLLSFLLVANEQMALQGRRNDLWYITPLMIQNLVGGRKEAINAYLDVHHEELDAHHTQYQILRHFNRKALSPEEAIMVPEEPTEYPWGQPADFSDGDE